MGKMINDGYKRTDNKRVEYKQNDRGREMGWGNGSGGKKEKKGTEKGE